MKKLPLAMLIAFSAMSAHAESLSFRIKSAPDEAIVLLDGKDAGDTTPMTVEVEDNATHTIELRKPGYDAVTFNIVTVEGNVRKYAAKTQNWTLTPNAETRRKAEADPAAKLIVAAADAKVEESIAKLEAANERAAAVEKAVVEAKEFAAKAEASAKELADKLAVAEKARDDAEAARKVAEKAKSDAEKARDAAAGEAGERAKGAEEAKVKAEASAKELADKLAVAEKARDDAEAARKVAEKARSDAEKARDAAAGEAGERAKQAEEARTRAETVRDELAAKLTVAERARDAAIAEVQSRDKSLTGAADARAKERADYERVNGELVGAKVDLAAKDAQITQLTKRIGGLEAELATTRPVVEAAAQARAKDSVLLSRFTELRRQLRAGEISYYDYQARVRELTR